MSDSGIFGVATQARCEETANVTPAERVAALYEAYRTKIYRFLVGQGLDPSNSQELTQEAFVRLFVALTKGNEIEAERAWLFAVASKLAVDYWRREGRPMWVELDSVLAKEVLVRVHVADAQRDAMRKDQVIRQRIHIRKISHGDSHSTFDQIDAWKSQTTVYWNVSEQDAAAAELGAAYQKHNIAKGLPLSGESADAWARAAGDSPTVSEHGTDLSLNYGGSLKGATDSVEQVNIVVQQSTWQIKKMTLDFHDVSFEVMADDYSILPKREVPTALRAHLEPYAAPLLNPGPAALHSLTNSASNVIHLPMVNLDKTELDVFTTLHGLGADLGEPVTVTHSSEAVLVGLWQLPGDRQAELRAALAGKPGVHVMLTEPHAPLRRVLVDTPASDAARSSGNGE